MPGNTPNQGYSYPLVTDAPCNLPATLLSVANALDSKAQGYDTDAARMAKRRWVKISKSNFQYGSNGDDNAQDIAFNAVEYNNGTSTDLTLDPYNVRLAPGFWLVTGKVTVPTDSSGQDFRVLFGFYDLGIQSQMTGANTYTRDFGNGLTTLSIQDCVYASPADSLGLARVCLSFKIETSGTWTVDYASLAAWWIADS